MAKRTPKQKRKPSAKMPDFMARRKRIFGGKVGPDSQPLLDEMRGDRY